MPIQPCATMHQPKQDINKEVNNTVDKKHFNNNVILTSKHLLTKYLCMLHLLHALYARCLHSPVTHIILQN